MPAIRVDQATLSDLDTLVPLFDEYRQFYGQKGDPTAARDFLRARFDHGESVLFLAWAGEVPVGFTQLYPGFSSVALARTFVLNDLYVRETARRQGVASRLIEASLVYARAMDAARVTLSTAITNTSAQALYQASGWTRDAQFLIYHYPLPVPAASEEEAQ